MKVYVCDSQGNKLLFKTYTAVSSEATEYSNGNWDREAVCSYFPATIEAAVNQFVVDYVLGDISSADSAEADASDSETSTASSAQSTSISIPKPAKPTTESAVESNSETSATESAE